jgi:chromosome segregation ATPase
MAEKDENVGPATEKDSTVENDDVEYVVPDEPAETGLDAKAAEDASAPGFMDKARGGWSALKEVGSAKRAHAEARAHLAQLEDARDTDQKELDRRTHVVDTFDEIEATLNQAISEAEASIESIQADIAGQESLQSQLEEELEALKKKHEHDLEPYRSLADTASERDKDAQRSLSEAKKTFKSADGAARDLAAKRDSRIATAKKALENAQNRRIKLENQLSSLQADPDAGAKEITKLKADLTSEIARLSAAKDELAAAQNESTAPIEQAQALAKNAKKSLDRAKKDADAAREESKKQQRELERREADAAEKEDGLEARIGAAKKQLVELERALKDEKDDAAAARSELEEATDIRDHPEEIEELAGRVADTQAAIDVKAREVDALAQQETEVRARTREQRIAFILVAVIAVAIAAAIVWFIVAAGR